MVSDDDSQGTAPSQYSQVTFPVVGGVTYYISVNSFNDLSAPFDNAGAYVLNWNATIPTIPSGTFRFASGVNLQGRPIYQEPSSGGSFQATITRVGGANGRALVNYIIAPSTYTNVFQTNFFGTTITTTYTDTNGVTSTTNTVQTTAVFADLYGYYSAGYQQYPVTGAITNTAVQIIVGTVTNPPVAGPSGVLTPTPAIPPLGTSANPPSVVTNADGSINTAVTNTFSFLLSTNQVVPSATGVPANGALAFDDFQMAATVTVPVGQNYSVTIPGGVQLPGLLAITLTNAVLDPLESSDLIAPTSDQIAGTALISILNNGFVTGFTTNLALAGVSIFNFQQKVFQVAENVNGSNATITVVRSGNVGATASVDYEIDYNAPRANALNTFALQPGSDYAKPDTANPPALDFTSVTGTLNFGIGQLTATFNVPINNDGIVEFNEDMELQLFNASPAPPNAPYSLVGDNGIATLTILFNDQPAGAVDRTWNVENSPGSNPANILYPGTSGGVSDSANGNGGTVYAVAEQPDGNALVAGSFISFDDHAYNRIVRVLNNGYQDPTFLVAPNSGANSFISAMVLQPDGRIIIGGDFTSFNGFNRHHIARLNADGSVDTSFNPGLGVNGNGAEVWSIALQPSGQMIIAGTFTSYNGTNVNSVARLNADGSLDPTFNPGTGPDGVINAVVVDALGRVIIGGDFDAVAGSSCGGVARLNVDGSVDSTFALGIGTYNPATGFTDPVYALALQPNGQILVGGAFSYVDLISYNGIVRLNTDGTVDLTFNPGTGTYNPLTGISDQIYAITLQPDGNILIGGDFTTFNMTRRVGVARLFSAGTVDTSFMDTAYNQFAGLVNHYHNPNANNPAIYPQGNQRNYADAIALEPNGNVIIGGAFLRVGGGNTRDDIHPRSNVARLIGGATPGPGNIQFSYSSYSVDKNGGSLSVLLTRNNGNLGIISATFATNMAAPGPGIASVTNFTVPAASTRPTWGTLNPDGNNPQNLGWMYGDGSSGGQNISLTINNNANYYGNVNANMLLSNPVGTNFFLGGEEIPLGAAMGSQIEAPLTIIDDNIHPGVLGFSAPQYSVLESGGTATITVTRTGGSDGAVSVNYATANGSSPNGATNGVDYVGSTNTVTLQAGQTSKTFSISIINGSLVRPDRTLNLRLYNGTGGATLGLTNATLTIINGNFTSGHVSFTSATYGTNENAGYAFFTVNRLGGGSGTIKVTAITSDGSAVNGINYLGSTNVFTWNNGDTTNRTIAVPVIDDGLVTTNLTVNLRLTNALLNSSFNSLILGNSTYTNATLIISNVDSYGTVQFSSPVYSVKKSGGYALIPVTRIGGSRQTVDVNYATVPGTAADGVNYYGTNGSLHFAVGEVSKYVTVPVIEDNQIDGPLALSLILTNASPANAMGAVSNAVLNIIDSDQVNEPSGSPDPTYGAFGFNNTVYALAQQSNNQLLVGGDFTEADGVPRQRIARLNANGTMDASFLLPSFTMGADGSVRAIALQQDGRILVGGLFANFNSVAQSYITRLNTDGTLDSLFNPGSGADNPVYALAETFVGGQSKVLVGGSFATIDGTSFNGIARLNSDGTPDSTFNPGLGANATVYALALQADGKVVIGGDFTAVNGNTNFNHIARLNTDGSLDFTFNPGTGASDSVRAITIQLDGRILLGGLFTSVNGNTNFNHIARLNADGSADTNFVSGLGANASVSCIALQTDSRIVVGGQFTLFSGVTRNRITRLMPNGAVDPTINFGSGANNFVAAMVIQQDTIAGYPTNVPDEKIIIGGGFTQYDNQSHPYLARIYGGSISGSGAFEFSSGNYSVDENGTNVLITVVRTGGTSGTNADGSGDVLVPFATSDGTGVAWTNYIPVITNLDFPLGEVIRTVSIPVIDDNVITPNLTVNLEVDPVPPAQYGNQPTAVLTIINDDSSVSFSAANYQVAKNIVSGTAPINIVRQGSTSGAASLNFTTTGGGTAVPTTDYTPVTQTVTFNPGMSNATVYIPINNNGIPEGNRTVTMQIAGATGTTLVSPTNATLTIIDTVNAPGQLAFAAPSYTITEGGGVGYTNAYITVNRVNGSSGTVSVNYSTLDGTALAGAKYSATNGVLTFGDGESTKSFFVQVRNTTTAEGPESLSIVLSNPTGGSTLAIPSTTVLTILNTNTGIAFASAANAYTEPSGAAPGTVALNVVRFNNTNGTTTVTYSTTNGTAVAGTDFVGVNNAVLTFNPGESVKPILISTLHDPSVTGDLSFTVGLANPSGSAQLTPPSFTVVTDHDADAGLSFITNQTSVLRNAGYAIIVVVCSNTNVEPVYVNYSTGGGSAIPGVDYTVTSGTLAFTNGLPFQPYNYFLVPILLNNQVQTNRDFYVTLSSPTAPGVLWPPSLSTEHVTIIGTNTPAGLSFVNPIIISGDWGSTNANNTFGAPELNDPSIAGQPASAPVWFQWTAPADGEVALDTLNSYDTNSAKLDTVLGVFTGSNLSSLNQVAANDDLYPQLLGNLDQEQENYVAQNIFNTNSIITPLTSYTISNGTLVPITLYITNNTGLYSYVSSYYFQPYGGPSGLRFNAKANTTYFIAADTKASFTSYTISNGFLIPIYSGRGNISLNWAYHPSGVLRFATEDIDQTSSGQASLINLTGTATGNPMLLYECSEAEADAGLLGLDRGSGSGVNADQYDTTIASYYRYDAPGLLVTVTRVAGASGRIAVDYTTVDPGANVITNGDIPAQAGLDYTAVSGTLVFDDYEMSKTILIPILDDYGLPRPNRDFMIQLSNPRRDAAESSHVSAPRVDTLYGQAMCRILDCDIDPKGPTSSQVVNTNFTPAITNIVISLTPTNPIFSFPKKNYRVPRDVQSGFWHGTPVTVYVNRMGTNTSGVTLNYRIDNYFLDDATVDDDNIYFPLMAGSDYATPFTANPPKDGAIFGPTNFDFQGIGGSSGTLTFPSGNKAFTPQPIHFTIFNNGLPQFNKDIHISLYETKNNALYQDGMVAECTLTILFDDLSPPAGSVDEFYNPDFAVDIAVPTNNVGSAVPHPGTEAFSEVYSVAVTTNDQTVIGGAFSTYTDGHNTYTVNGLARLTLDGSLDTTFNSGSGINVFPGGEFIRSVALSGSQVVIGGDFSSYNGIQRNNIARVNGDGSLDTTFTPGSGANGQVWSVLAQPDGKVIIGGEFTSYNAVAANHVARLNTDGSLDTTFNASNIITGPVYAMSLPGDPPFNFNHASNGSTNEDDQVLKLGLRTSGNLIVNYNMTSLPERMLVYYGNTNVAAGTGVLLFDTGSITNPPGVGGFTVAFGPTAGFTTNIITIVMNPGGSINPTPVVWSYNASIPGQTGLLIGGHFNVAGQTYANVARLNVDGSLDTTFSPSTGPDGSVLSVDWQPDNKIIAGGSFKHVSGVPFNNLARLNVDGSIDANFFIGTGADNTVNSITLQPVTGSIYVGGPFTSMNGTHRLGFARLNADGTLDTTFLDTAYNQLAGLPRLRYVDPPGTVYSSGIQSDGRVMIGGSFSQVGGGQFDELVRPDDYGFDSNISTVNTLNANVWPEPKARDGVRNRGNVARLIGGATPGPGNIGLGATTYAANKTQSFEAVTMVRTNGSLGYATANFSVLPGLAQSGMDYSYSGNAPTYPIEWEFMGPTRQHSDGLFGNNDLMNDNYGYLWKFGFAGPASANVSIINNTTTAGNLSAHSNWPIREPTSSIWAVRTYRWASPSVSPRRHCPSWTTHTRMACSVSLRPPILRPMPVRWWVSSAPMAPLAPCKLNYQTTTNGSTAVAGTDYQSHQRPDYV